MTMSAAKEKVLQERMRRLAIREEDLEETFLHSSGPGGQNVNKVSTCVYLRHCATGIFVKCQTYRSQAKNREEARFLLIEKLEKYYYHKEFERQAKEAKLRRQTRRKPKNIKEEILRRKHIRSDKKAARRKVTDLE